MENKEIGDNLINQIRDTYYYNEFFWALIETDIDTIDALERKNKVKKKYYPLFKLIEKSLNYSVVLSISHFLIHLAKE